MHSGLGLGGLDYLAGRQEKGSAVTDYRPHFFALVEPSAWRKLVRKRGRGVHGHSFTFGTGLGFLRLHISGHRKELIVEGFLKGLTFSPKPIKGLEAHVIAEEFSTDLPIKDVLISLTSAAGLSSWLGATQKFLPHVGIKLNTKINDEDLQGVISAFELPKRIVFVFEKLGELDFAIKLTGNQVNVQLKISRSLLPSEEQEWRQLASQVIVSLRNRFGKWSVTENG